MKLAPYLIVIGLPILPSCVMEDRGGGHYVIRAKTGEEYRKEDELKRQVEEYTHPTGNAPSVAGKTYKVIPDGRMMNARVKFLPGGNLTYTKVGGGGLNGAGGQWKQDRNTLGFQVDPSTTPTYMGRICGEHHKRGVTNRSGYAPNFTGITGSASTANERAIEERDRHSLVTTKLNLSKVSSETNWPQVLPAEEVPAGHLPASATIT